MHYVPSKYEKIGSILQNRTEINHSRDVLEGRDLPQGYEPPTGYVDYEFKGVNHAQLALEIPDNWWQNVGVAEGHESEDDLPRLMFRGIPQDEREVGNSDSTAGVLSVENYHYMARQDEFKGLREAFRYHDKDCRRHVPPINVGDIPGYGQQGKFLRPGGECDHYGYGGRHPEWAVINPIDMPIVADLPIIYDRFNGRITHQTQDEYDGPIPNDNMYNTIKVNETGHVTRLLTRTIGTLRAGNGFAAGTPDYNTSQTQVWGLNFTTAGGDNGTSNTVARGNHNHDSSYSQLYHTHAWSEITDRPTIPPPCDCGDGGGGGDPGEGGFDGSDYVLKAGDTMTGTLTLPTLLVGFPGDSNNANLSQTRLDFGTGDNMRAQIITYVGGGIGITSYSDITLTSIQNSANNARARIRITNTGVYAESRASGGSSWVTNQLA